MPEATTRRLLLALTLVMGALFCAPQTAPGKALDPSETASRDFWEPRPDRVRVEPVRAYVRLYGTDDPLYDAFWKAGHQFDAADVGGDKSGATVAEILVRIVNEPLDTIASAGEVADGNITSLAGLLPFVPGAVSKVDDIVIVPKAGGPCSFGRLIEGMSDRAASCQSRITGRLPDVGYNVRGTKFDGFDEAAGVLLDAKGPGYARFVRDGQFQPWFAGADDLVAQAQRQLRAADGTPIRWHFAEEAAANATRGLFQSRGIAGIDIVVTP